MMVCVVVVVVILVVSVVVVVVVIVVRMVQFFLHEVGIGRPLKLAHRGWGVLISPLLGNCPLQCSVVQCSGVQCILV